jgi:membrane protein YdbS with pleckstrin-like domain
VLPAHSLAHTTAHATAAAAVCIAEQTAYQLCTYTMSALLKSIAGVAVQLLIVAVSLNVRPAVRKGHTYCNSQNVRALMR